MNPLDKEELKAFLQIIKKDMPLHTDKTVKIKRSFSQDMPKNLMDYSEKIDNEFLNNNLHMIEEMEYRKKGITNDFKNYQNKYYNESGILNHDLYFKHENKIYSKVSGSGVLINPYAFGIPQVNGAVLTTDQTVTDQSGFASYIYIGKLTNGVIGEYYDQSAVSRNGGTTTGNFRHGVYRESGGVPTALITDSGSIAVVSGYTYVSFTEVALVSVINYHAFQVDSNSPVFDRRLYGSAVNGYDTQGYGTFPNPSTYDAINYTGNIVAKIGHT